jgi:hypothetical protein
MKNVQTKSKLLFNYWLVAEKIIGCVLLLWSVFVIASMLSVVSSMLRYGYIAAGNTSLSSIAIEKHLIIIISILCLSGSWMLLFRNKAGWILCTVSSLIYGINLLLSSRSKAVDNDLAFAEHYKSYGIASLLFLIIFILLLLKPIRTKYQPTIKTWIIISVIIILSILDSYFLSS